MSPRLAHQWSEVLNEPRDAGRTEERLRIALLNVDYVTSFELPFRLLLVRAPQLIAGAAAQPEECGVQRQRFGCVYSLKSDLSGVPEAFQYSLSTRIHRRAASGVDALPYRNRQALKAPRERLRLALEQGLPVTALDGLFWFGIQRIAAEVRRLRKTGMAIVTAETEIFDT